MWFAEFKGRVYKQTEIAVKWSAMFDTSYRIVQDMRVFVHPTSVFVFRTQQPSTLLCQCLAIFSWENNLQIKHINLKSLSLKCTFEIKPISQTLFWFKNLFILLKSGSVAVRIVIKINNAITNSMGHIFVDNVFKKVQFLWNIVKINCDY